MKKQGFWLLLIAMMVSLTAQTLCFASSGAACMKPGKKKAVVSKTKTDKPTSHSKYWVLGALFKS